MSRTERAIVRARAGASYPDRPLHVFWRGGWRAVSEVEHEQRHPSCRCFTVRLAPTAGSQDDTRLRLCYHYANDAWSVEPQARPIGPSSGEPAERGDR